MKCNYCGVNSRSNVPKYREEYKEYLCWNCYTHYKEHPVNKLPEKGEIKYDEEGRVVCHICGRAYDRLAAHIRYKHNMTKDEYREEFGLNRTQRLTSEGHSNKLSKLVRTHNNIALYRNKDVNGKGKKAPRYGKTERLQAKINRAKKRTVMNDKK